MTTVAPYGSWRSPISVADLTAGSVGLSAVRVDGNHVYWLESRSDQGGRVALWRSDRWGRYRKEVTPPMANVRSRVHEYGGGEYAVAAGVVVYSEFADNRLYQLRDGEQRPISPAGAFRYADLALAADRGIVLAVREDHRGPGEPVNTIVALGLDDDNLDGGTVLASGADFYSSPALSAGGQLVWTQWDHPNMPWDSTVICVAQLPADAGGIGEARTVAGGSGVSAVAPTWRDEDLLFVDDVSDWWNLRLLGPDGVRPVLVADAEFCTPQWQFGQSPYALLGPDRLLAIATRGGEQQLLVVDLDSGATEPVPGAYNTVFSLAVGDGFAAAIVGYPDRPATLSVFDLADRTWSVVRQSSTLELAPDAVSRAVAVSWSDSGGAGVHGWYYPPASADHQAPDGELPPLITLSHGGPTACAGPEFKVGYQFWTSRGFAILDVNYGGSTGYGRDYRERLLGRWGLVDVADCIGGATAMGSRGLADPERLVIRGGSAGGFTTLAALTESDAFAAGISLYGIGDLELLARDTHKFESRYLDRLVGPYPQDRETYIERSPIHHVDRLSAPLLLLQGLDDKVVPPNQAELMADAVRDKGLPVALMMFPDEGHGFRRAETITAATNGQIYFLGRILGFTPADDVPHIPIDNLSAAARTR